MTKDRSNKMPIVHSFNNKKSNITFTRRLKKILKENDNIILVKYMIKVIQT